MLIYLEYVIEDLIVAAILAGVVLSYARAGWGRLGGRVVVGGIAVGLVGSAVMAFMKQNTSLVSTGDWNLMIFAASLAAAAVAGACQIARALMARRRGASEARLADAKTDVGSVDPKEAEGEGAPAKRPGGGEGSVAARVLGLVTLGALSLIVGLRVFYKVPDVINYPANFGISTDNLLSSDFAYRFIGWLLGIILVIVACIALAKAYSALDRKRLGAAAGLIVALVCFVQTVSLCQILIARRIIVRGTDLYGVMFPLTTWFSNNTVLITAIIVAVAIALAIVVIALSLRDAEPYRNPAEHRKNKARWRNRRRWAICAIACLAFALVAVTAIKDYNTQGPVIVESEDVEISDGYMRIPLSQVDDGHLHRFTYTTEAGVAVTPETGQPYTTQGGVGVRVIVVKKPGANAYGVGLDACDICGTTGYYERDGQVVCSKCDVVMNINTIGFKGGCNPIVIDYEMRDSTILIPLEALASYEKIPGSSW